MSVVEISKDEVIDNLLNVKTRSKKQQNALNEAEQLIHLLWEQVKQTPQSRFDAFKKIYTTNMEVMEKMNDEMVSEIKELKEENKKLLSPMECGGQLEKDLDELKEWRKIGKTSFGICDDCSYSGVSLMIDDMYENIKELKKENEKLHNSENVLRNHLNLRNKNIIDSNMEIKSLKQQIKILELSKK